MIGWHSRYGAGRIVAPAGGDCDIPEGSFCHHAVREFTELHAGIDGGFEKMCRDS